jgi:saccharopine dehydrogenase-like NADP-dependent oxidoreductase
MFSASKTQCSLPRSSAKPYYFTPAYNLVCYPNRDSSQFKEFYGLKDIQNLVRGTLRYGGFCEVVEAWKEIGLMDDTNVDYLTRDAEPLKWVELTAKLVSAEANEE